MARLKNCDFFREDKFKNEIGRASINLASQIEVLSAVFCCIITDQIFVHYRARHFCSLFEERRGTSQQDETVDERGIELIMLRMRKKIYRVCIFHGACGSPTWIRVPTSSFRTWVDPDDLILQLQMIYPLSCKLESYVALEHQPLIREVEL